MSNDPIRVLLVDDEEDFLEMLGLRLEAAGFELSTAQSGEACLEFLSSRKADVVILDVKMPGMDGIMTLGAIRKILPGLPVILMTGHGGEETRKQAQELGVSACFIKPADFAPLVAAIREAAQSR